MRTELNSKTLNACAEIEKQLAALTKFVAEKKERAERNEIVDWGELGDVKHISEVLSNQLEQHQEGGR